MWSSIGERERSILGPITWQEAIGNPGACQMRWVRAFMEALETMTAVPCQQIFTEECRSAGTLETHGQAAAGKDWIAVYLPSGGQVALDVTGVWNGGEAAVWYWSPRDGRFAREAEVLTVTGGFTVSAPTEGEEQDWLVILTAPGAMQPIPDAELGAVSGGGEAKKVFEW